MLLELTMQYLCQDPERWVCSQPLPVCELRWDGLLRGGHEGCQHLQDGRPQVPVWHTKLQPLHWFGTALRWGDMCVCVCVWDVWWCSLIVEGSWFLFSPQSVNSALFPPLTRPGPHNSPARCWGRRASGTSSTCPSPTLTSPIIARRGSSSSTLWEPNIISASQNLY